MSNIVRKYGGVRFETRYSDHQFRKGGSKGVGGRGREREKVCMFPTWKKEYKLRDLKCALGRKHMAFDVHRS